MQVEGRGPVGIALCRTSTVGFPALHLSATFRHGPLVAPRLEGAVLCCAREFVPVVVLGTILHVFHEFAVTGCLVALNIEKLGSQLYFRKTHFAETAGSCLINRPYFFFAFAVLRVTYGSLSAGKFALRYSIKASRSPGSTTAPHFIIFSTSLVHAASPAVAAL